MPKKLMVKMPVYEKLLAHLVDFEERRTQIVNFYFPEYNRQREDFKELIDEYVSIMDKAVKNVVFSESAENDFPFVCLNSEVEIEDMEECETYNYKLVLPETSYNGNNSITILSPMGKALLCKKVQEVISVNTPSGVYRYRIKSISLH